MTKNNTATAPVKALVGVKLGMTQVWNEDAKLVPVTVVKVGKNVVTQVRTVDNDGYSAVQIASGELKNKNVTKPLQGHFSKAGVEPRRFVAEVCTPDAESYELGQELGVDTFEAGQVVDVVGKSKGKGFAGTMKRHGFAGVSASHGSHRNHRKPGSIGASATPGRVFRGQKMAGRMGNARVTVQNLTIHAVDTENDLLLVSGAIPGNKGGAVVIRTAAKGA